MATALFLFWLPQALAQDLGETIEFCAACHGEAGLPIEPDIPIIWGQEFYYLYVQLKDYKAGRRENEIMQEIVSDLEKEQMQALAQHFSEKPWPRIGFRAEDTDRAKGASATSAGLCTQCHLGGYDGDSRNPRLAGQQPAYLERTMLEFKNKVRMNSPAKSSLLGAYEDADITAMARYLAGF
jgi:cytochrome c553